MLASWLPKWRETFKIITIVDAYLHRGLHTYILLNTSSVCVGIFTALQISSWTKTFTLECLQVKGRANATKGCFYEWGSCGFILLKRFMHLGVMLHCLNGAFLLWYDFILSLVQESCIKHLLSFTGEQSIGFAHIACVPLRKHTIAIFQLLQKQLLGKSYVRKNAPHLSGLPQACPLFTLMMNLQM